jgi:hypothetical protein
LVHLSPPLQNACCECVACWRTVAYTTQICSCIVVLEIAKCRANPKNNERKRQHDSRWEQPLLLAHVSRWGRPRFQVVAATRPPSSFLTSPLLVAIPPRRVHPPSVAWSQDEVLQSPTSPSRSACEAPAQGAGLGRDELFCCCRPQVLLTLKVSCKDGGLG